MPKRRNEGIDFIGLMVILLAVAVLCDETGQGWTIQAALLGIVCGWWLVETGGA